MAELPTSMEKLCIRSDVDPPMKEQIFSSIYQLSLQLFLPVFRNVVGKQFSSSLDVQREPILDVYRAPDWRDAASGIRNITKAEGSLARIVAKMESQQPGGSVKDRIGLAMILDAEEKGLITAGKTILVEFTSGNTGVSIAMVGKQRGYKSIIVMPDAYSMERRILLRALDAELVLTDAREGIAGLLKVAEDILAKTPNSHMLCQFRNQANPDAHFCSTGPEIWEGTAGKVDIFVAGVGTGGTITGTGRSLKSKNPNVKIVAVEPAESAFLSGGKPGSHRIQCIGPGFVPETLNVALLDGIVPVHSDDAIDMARRLMNEEGLLVGISSGAAFAAALRLAKEPENAGKLIVVVFPSGAERYLTTSLFQPLKDECEKMTFVK